MMSAESMTDFVRELFLRSEDFKSLTQNMIREQYMRHIGVTCMDDQNISLLRQIVEILLLEMMYNDGAAQANECSEEVNNQILVQDVATSDNPSESINNGTHFIIKDAANSIFESSTIALEGSVIVTQPDNRAWLAESSNVTTAKSLTHPENPSLIKKSEKTRFIYKEIQKKRPSEKQENDDTSGIRFEHLLKSKKKSTEGKGWVVINLGSNMTRTDIGKLLQKRRPGITPKKKKKKMKKKETAKKTIRVLDSESESDSDTKCSSTTTKTTSTVKRKRAAKKDAHEQRLEKVARSCGILPVGKNYKTTFEGCKTSKERSDKLVLLLREAGMKGPITKKNAEEFRLKREAQELEDELKEKKITVTEGRSHRNVYSIYSRHAYNPKPLNSAATSPMKARLSRCLIDVIDSEESSDD